MCILLARIALLWWKSLPKTCQFRFDAAAVNRRRPSPRPTSNTGTGTTSARSWWSTGASVVTHPSLLRSGTRKNQGRTCCRLTDLLSSLSHCASQNGNRISCRGRYLRHPQLVHMILVGFPSIDTRLEYECKAEFSNE